MLDITVSAHILEPDVDDEGNRIYHTTCEACEATIPVGEVVTTLLDVRLCETCARTLAQDILQKVEHPG